VPVGKPDSKITRCRCEDNIKADRNSIGWAELEWNHPARDTVQMQSLVNMTINMISIKEQETQIFEQLRGSQTECTPRRSLVKTVLLWVVALWTDFQHVARSFEWVNFGPIQVTIEDFARCIVYTMPPRAWVGGLS
jgi:hypothetical protein